MEGDVQSLEASADLGPAARPRAGMTLTRRAALNGLAAALDIVARAGVELVLNPLLVGRLGDHLYGAWRFLWRLTGSVHAASGRSSQALKLSIANRKGSVDEREKRELVGSAIGVWLLFLPLLALAGGAAAWLAPSFLRTAPEVLWSVRGAALMLVAYVIVSSVVDVPRAILQGENLGYKRMGLSAFLVILGGALMALAVDRGAGIIGVAAANLVTMILTGVLFVLVVRTHVSWAGIARPTLAALGSFVRLSWWFVVWKLVTQAMLAGDVMVLGLAGSVESVTIYTLTAFVPGTVLSLDRLLVAGVAPGLGELIGSGNWRAAARVRAEVMTLTWLAAISTGATVLIWNRPFLRVWVGEAYYAGTIETLLIILMVGQFALLRNDANFIDLTLTIRRKVLLGLLSVFLSLILAALFVGGLGGGISGLCVGIIAGRILLTFEYPRQVGRLLGLSWRRQVMAVLRPAAATVVIFAAAFTLAGSPKAETWLALSVGPAVTFVAIVVSSVLLGLSGADRDALRSRIRRVFHAAA